jgi:hypothetical protein
VTADHIDTMKATNPKMLAKAQAKLERELEAMSKPVPVGIRSSTRLVLGVPQVDPSLSRLMQANYAPVSPAKSGPSKPFKLTDHTTLNRSRSKE